VGQGAGGDLHRPGRRAGARWPDRFRFPAAGVKTPAAVIPRPRRPARRPQAQRAAARKPLDDAPASSEAPSPSEASEVLGSDLRGGLRRSGNARPTPAVAWRMLPMLRMLRRGCLAMAWRMNEPLDPQGRVGPVFSARSGPPSRGPGSPGHEPPEAVVPTQHDALLSTVM
jgi:hypothetical protein